MTGYKTVMNCILFAVWGVFAQTNLVSTNPGFENDFAGWSNNGGASISSDAHSGSKSVHSEYQGGISYSTGIYVGDATEYTFSFYAKKAGTISWAGVGIDFTDGARVEIDEEIISSFSTTWRQESVSGTLPEGTDSVFIWTWKSGDGGSLYMDDFSFTTNGGTQMCTVTVASSGSSTFPGTGTVSPSGQVILEQGATISLSATPDVGNHFSFWYNSGAPNTVTFNDASSESTVATVTGNTTILGFFTIDIYTLTVNNNGNGTTNPAYQQGAMSYGKDYPLIAIPNTGYQFDGWNVVSGNPVIADMSAETTTVAMYDDAEVFATFSAIQCTLSISSSSTPHHGGTGTVTPQGEVILGYGESISVSATPEEGSRFAYWYSAYDNTTIENTSASTTTITAYNNDGIIGFFGTETYTLTILTDGNGTTNPADQATLFRDQGMNISATPNNGFVFSQWTIESGSPTISDVNTASTIVTLSSGDASIKATFIPDPGALNNNQKIAISAELYDDAGVAVDGDIDVIVNLHTSATGGSAVYTEQFLAANNEAITVDQGALVARLGDGTANANLASVLASNPNLWAEIIIDGETPDTLEPRMELNAAPYAVAPAVVTGAGDPNTAGVDAPIGHYYVDTDTDNTWIKLSAQWKVMD